MDLERAVSLVGGVMSRHVDTGVGGLAWGVSLAGETVVGAAGHLDPPAGSRPMPANALFRVASVSKPLAAVAVLQLVDDGLIRLDDPIDRVVPELAEREVLVDPAGPVNGPTVPAERPITVRDLLTFRCGLGMDFDFSRPQPLLERMWQVGVGPGPTAPDMAPDEFLDRLSGLPLADQPGTRWRYHTGSDVAGVLVERLRGESLDVVMSRDLFEPVGMTDTGFRIRDEQMERFGACRQADDTGQLVVWDEPDGRWAQAPAFRSGATGLVSTVSDLIAFARMLAAGGRAGARRVLSEEMVAEMTSDQLSAEQRQATSIDSEGFDTGWGLGVGVRAVDHPDGWPLAGTIGWDGGLGSRWLVDPSTGIAAALLSTDGLTSASPPEVMVDFVTAIAASVVG